MAIGNIMSNIKQGFQNYATNLSGSRVKALDEQIKPFADLYNSRYGRTVNNAQKNILGKKISPFREVWTNHKLGQDKNLQALENHMALLNEQRRIASKTHNAAIGKTALGTAAVAGSIVGGTYLKKKWDEHKQQKEMENYYKTASVVDFVKSQAQAVANNVSGNFAHAPEFSDMYGQSKAKGLIDVATGKRVYSQGKILKAIKKNDTDALRKAGLSDLAQQMEDVSISNSDWIKNKIKLSKLKKEQSDLAASELHSMLKDKSRPYKYSTDYFNNYIDDKGGKSATLQKTIKNQENITGAVINQINSKQAKMKSTRNNELAKTIGLYSIPVAATVGGIYLYKKHKKKQQAKKDDKPKKDQVI